MLSSAIEDTPWVDSFDLPSIFDPRLQLYKEWHDFVFYDRSSRFFGLLNFAVHGNPYDSRRGYGAAMAFLVDTEGKAHGALKLIHLDDLTVSPFTPDFVGGGIAISYDRQESSFSIKGRVDDVRFDLDASVLQAPVTMNQIGVEVLSKNPLDSGMLGAAGDMAKVWDKWVELPKLGMKGKMAIGAKDYPIDTTTGYQDHEAGRFDWGTIAGWDTGVLLTEPETGDEPQRVSFLVYRYGTEGESAYGGVIVRSKEGRETFFDSNRMTISRLGEFAGDRVYVPGVTRLLYPDYRPKVPKKIVFSGTAKSDRFDNTVEIVFVPKAVCTIVVASMADDAETTFNEMYCEAALDATVAGETYRKTIPCWFESVRPRRGMRRSAP